MFIYLSTFNNIRPFAFGSLYQLKQLPTLALGPGYKHNSVRTICLWSNPSVPTHRIPGTIFIFWQPVCLLAVNNCTIYCLNRGNGIRHDCPQTTCLLTVRCLIKTRAGGIQWLYIFPELKMIFLFRIYYFTRSRYQNYSKKIVALHVLSGCTCACHASKLWYISIVVTAWS